VRTAGMSRHYVARRERTSSGWDDAARPGRPYYVAMTSRRSSTRSNEATRAFTGNGSQNRVYPMFARVGELTEFPLDVLPEAQSLPETAYQVVHDEAMLDGNSRLNLATFVGTWMDPYASKLYAETADKNMVDKDEYPQTAAIETRCWRMIAALWNAPDAEKVIGTSTIGSSEACMLGGLAFKRRWQQSRRAAGKPTDKPNLILSSAVQVCWEKFCNYWDVEPRYVPISLEHKVLDGHDLDRYVDENTIGVVAIMGVTYTGMYEPVAEIAAALDRIQQKTGLDIPNHVDGASGGMIAPFLQPELVWDFRLERVASISTSAHKYGLAYPGLGWVIWRTVDDLPADLVFDVTYLGGHMPSSRSTSPARGRRCSCSTTSSFASASTAITGCRRPAKTWPCTSPARSARCRPSSCGMTALTSPCSPGSCGRGTPTSGTYTTSLSACV
jgi:glutamate decarboxylase